MFQEKGMVHYAIEPVSGTGVLKAAELSDLSCTKAG